MKPHQTNRSIVRRLRVACAFPLVVAGALLMGCAHEDKFKDEGVSPAQSLPMNSFQLQWTAQLETTHGPVTRLFAADTLIIGYTEDGTSYVMDRASGVIQHAETIRHGSDALHPPVVLKEFIVYPTNTSLEVYDRKGALIRSKDLNYSIRSDAVGDKTYVYFGADYVAGGRLVAVDVTSEYLDHRWFLMTPKSGLSSTPAVYNDIVYSASENGDVTAVASDSREPVWPLPNGVFHTYDPVTADLAVDGSGVYVASTDMKLVSLNPKNGRVKWQYLAAGPLLDAPVVTKDLVFQRVPGVGIVVIDKLKGEYNRVPRWTAADVAKVLAQGDKYVYVLREDKTLMALDKQTGKATFTSKRRDLVAFATNNRDGTVYAVTTANRVMAITPVLKPGTVGEMAWEPVREIKRIAYAH